MAEFVRNWTKRQKIVDTVFEVCREAAERRKLEYDSAVKIQAWFRGLRVRAYYRILNNAAVTIQKNFRGYLARKVYRVTVKECLGKMRVDFYHKNAACIQRFWRGHYVRKYVHNYYALKAYLEGLALKNEAILGQLKTYEEQTREEEKARMQKLAKLNFEREACQKHYMMSTESMAGVFKPLHTASPHPLETAMGRLRIDVQALKRKQHHKKINAIQCLHDGEIYSSATSVSTKDPQRLIALGESCISPALVLAATANGTSNGQSSYNILPPIPTKVQGPFKKPEEVIRQKFKPLQPTLRVTTSYESVEIARAEIKAKEWRQRIHDNKFLPFSKQFYSSQPGVNSSLPFNRPAYGSRHFRETDAFKNISKVDFNTNIPSIPIFEKLNSTY
ncbi:spermatogenesis-associated protein 17-like [Dysidea avara]|uniref:spermatogenesis-associated protein 17-like n=1 Tax=Dysidea avara TaxID=196820 RepID=UPI00332316CB